FRAVAWARAGPQRGPGVRRAGAMALYRGPREAQRSGPVERSLRALDRWTGPGSPRRPELGGAVFGIRLERGVPGELLEPGVTEGAGTVFRQFRGEHPAH